MKRLKIIVEKHPEGYVAYPLGLKGVVIGEGDTYEEALEDVKSAIKFHIETFKEEIIESEEIEETFIAEVTVQMKFPKDAPKRKVIKTFELLGFKIVREGQHISMIKQNPDGTKTPLTMPNHRKIKGSTLRVICRQAKIKREDFLSSYQNT